MCVCVGVRGGGGGHSLVKIFYCFFSCFRPFRTVFKCFLSPLYFFQKIKYFDGWGVPPMENSMKFFLLLLKPSLKGIADTRIKDLINHMSGLGKQGRMIKLVDIR